MPLEAPVTRDDRVFLGEDRKLRFAIYADAAQTTMQDVAGWALSWKLVTKPGDTTALITKTVGSGIAITGAFNASPALNTQRIEVTIDDTDTEALSDGTKWHELKRTDNALETVLAHGTFYLHQPVHRT